jgi:hypothetical protein
VQRQAVVDFAPGRTTIRCRASSREQEFYKLEPPRAEDLKIVKKPLPRIRMAYGGFKVLVEV